VQQFGLQRSLPTNPRSPNLLVEELTHASSRASSSGRSPVASGFGESLRIRLGCKGHQTVALDASFQSEFPGWQSDGIHIADWAIDSR